MDVEDIDLTDAGEYQIERRETGVRIALSLLYFLIAQVLETVLALIVGFELVYALVTKRPPGPAVRQFANGAVSYVYRMGRYLTYNEHVPPFPLAEFPPEVERIGPGHPDAEDDPSWESELSP